MAPTQYLVRRGGGSPKLALHPDKRTALAELLAGAKRKAAKRSKTGKRQAPAGSGQGLENQLYRVHDPVYSYLKRQSRG